MSLLRLTLLLAVALAVGCEKSPQIPNAAKQKYPVLIKDSPERREKAEREWRRMLNSYGVEQTPPDLYPITYTPRSLLGVTGGIQILGARPEPGNETFALRTAVKSFLDRWRELIGADPVSISLVRGDETGATRRLTYRQANFAYPVAGQFGEMVAVIGDDGKLLQLDDRFLPVVELPLTPAIERDAAARRVVGRTFTYSDIAGREQRETINSLDQVSVKRVVVVPLEKGDAIEVRLAWEIVAGSSLSWTVYVDAITGEELKVVQNFNT
jgi:hypothetical protein